MGDLTLIALTANSKDGARQALEVAKALDRDGWIELMDYGLMSKDKKGHIATREMDDDLSEKVAAAGVGVAGGVAGGMWAVLWGRLPESPRECWSELDRCG